MKIYTTSLLLTSLSIVTTDSLSQAFAPTTSTTPPLLSSPSPLLSLRECQTRNVHFPSTSRLFMEGGGGGKEVEDIPRPDPSILISSKSDNIQKLSLAAIATSLFIGTYGFTQLFTLIESILPDGWWEFYITYLVPVPMGLIFTAAGISHFALKEAFTSIVPPKGTWGGLWNVPAPGIEALQEKNIDISYEEYHTYWTGIAELGGGLLLIGCGVGILDFVPIQIPSALVGLLVLAITPANVYMFTHDAVMGGEDGGDGSKTMPPKIPYPEGHIVRGIAQCFLLALFWKLTFQ